MIKVPEATSELRVNALTKSCCSLPLPTDVSRRCRCRMASSKMNGKVVTRLDPSNVVTAHVVEMHCSP